MNGPIRRVALALFAMFGVLLSAVTYFQVIAGPDYRDDPRNLRVVAGRAGRERGTIITSDGVVVARSVPNPEDARVFRRDYPEGSLYAHAVGYATLLFGDAALEEKRGRHPRVGPRVHHLRSDRGTLRGRPCGPRESR